MFQTTAPNIYLIAPNTSVLDPDTFANSDHNPNADTHYLPQHAIGEADVPHTGHT